MPFAPTPPPPEWWHRYDPRRSWTALAAVVVGGSATVLAILLAGIVAALLHGQLERQLGGSFETLAREVADKIDRSVYERYRQLEFTASLAALRNPALAATERRAVIDLLRTTSPDLAWLGFTDAGGLVRVASPRLFEGENVGNTPWFRNGQRRPFAGNVHEWPALAARTQAADGEPPRFLDLAVPVNAADGQFLGVLSAQVRWSMAREVQVSVVPDAARRQLLGVTIYAATGETLLDSGGSGWTEPPEAPAGVPKRPEAHGYLEENSPGGTTYLAGYARSGGFREFRGLGWLIVVRQPVDQVFAPVAELRRRVLGLGLAFAAVLGGVTAFGASRIERRLRAVAKAAGRIGEGEIQALIPRPRGDHALARMCAALDEMVEKFRRREEARETEAGRIPAKNEPR